MSKPKPAPLPAGTVVGGYQIIKRLAAGGFGVVYLDEKFDPARGLVLEGTIRARAAERKDGAGVRPARKPGGEGFRRRG